MVTMRSLAKNQPDLKITERDIEITGVAGLIHDLGHGPGSHAFDTFLYGCRFDMLLSATEDPSKQVEKVSVW